MKTLSDYEQKIDRLSENCPERAAIDVIRGRWKPSILFELKNDTKRFSDCKPRCPGSRLRRSRCNCASSKQTASWFVTCALRFRCGSSTR